MELYLRTYLRMLCHVSQLCLWQGESNINLADGSLCESFTHGRFFRHDYLGKGEEIRAETQ